MYYNGNEVSILPAESFELTLLLLGHGFDLTTEAISSASIISVSELLSGIVCSSAEVTSESVSSIRVTSADAKLVSDPDFCLGRGNRNLRFVATVDSDDDVGVSILLVSSF